MCWLCGCADHIGLGNDREPSEESDPNQLNAIIEE
jgi:hypothetical protein